MKVLEEAGEVIIAAAKGVLGFLVDNFIPILAAVCITGAIVVGAVATSGPTISLKKSEWVCTQQELRNTVAVVNTVGVNGQMSTASVPTVEAVCVNYKRTK